MIIIYILVFLNVLLCEPLSSCSTAIYDADRSHLIAVQAEKGECLREPLLRRIQLESKNSLTGQIRYLEVLSEPSAVYYCSSDLVCEIILNGYGVKQGDRLIIRDTNERCGTRGKILAEAHATESHGASLRSINSTRPHVFSLFRFRLNKQMQGEFKLCFVPRESYSYCNSSSFLIPTEYYFQEAGTLIISDNVKYTCRFDKGSLQSCGFYTYSSDSSIDFKWEIGSASQVAGAGPIKNYSLSNESYDVLSLMFKDEVAGLPYGEPQDNTNISQINRFAMLKSPGYLGSKHNASLISIPLRFDKGSYCLSFGYNISGRDASELRVYFIKSDVNDTTNFIRNINLDHLTDLQWSVTGDKGPDWATAHVGLDVDESGSYMIVFQGFSGESELCVMSLASVTISNKKCHDIRSINDDSRLQFSQICGEVQFIPGKSPQDKSWYVEGAINCYGRNYSKADTTYSWVPCCIPSYGSYNVMLQDRSGHGWEGSKLLFKFADRVYTIENNGKNTGETSVALDVGLIKLQSHNYSNNQLKLQVVTIKPYTQVICGLVDVSLDADPVIPTAQLLKQHGMKADQLSQSRFDTVIVMLQGSYVKSNNDYDIYCYAEVFDSPSSSQPILTMSDREVAGSRYRLTTDVTAPEFKVASVTNKGSNFKVSIIASEPSSAWCVVLNTSNELIIKRTIDVDYFLNNGIFLKFIEPTNSVSFQIPSLVPTMTYHLYCYGKDNALPFANQTSYEDMQQPITESDGTIVEFSADDYAPIVSVQNIAVVQNGFDVYVTLSHPGEVSCAAGTENIHDPTVDSVYKVGQKAKLTESMFNENRATELVIQIRGTAINEMYKIYCAAVSSSGKKRTKNKTMWAEAISIRSYGQFCSIDNDDNTVEIGKGTVFDPVTASEELSVRRFLLNDPYWHIDSLYRIDLYLNKEVIYNHLYNGGVKPERYARVRLGRCTDGKGYYEQLKVGPLDDMNKMTWERIAKPTLTSCDGYSASGVFGRRLVANKPDLLNEFLQKALNVGFGEQCRVDNDVRNTAESQNIECLNIGIIVIDSNKIDNLQDDSKVSNVKPERVFVGLRSDTIGNLNLYLEIATDSLSAALNAESNLYNIAKVSKILRERRWSHYNGPIWLKAHRYDTVEALIKRFETDISTFKNEVLSRDGSDFVENNRSSEDFSGASSQLIGTERILALTPYNGGAGTGGLDMPRSSKRAGLEYKIPPEHIEPNGKRYKITVHPTNNSFTIDYAGWNFTITNDRDKSLQFWDVKFQGERILFNLGLQEAMAHYTVAERTFFFMDSWYGGLGGSARPILRGYECPKTSSLLFNDQSVCIFEKDEGRPIRSHYRSGEIRDAAGHYSLNIRQMITVSNYDYITTYTFHPSGHIEATISFTGELYAGVEVPWYSARQSPYGTLVTGAMRHGALHAHLAIWKFDFDLENYKDNSVYFEHVIADPKRPGANYLNRFFPTGELDAALKVTDGRSIGYSIVAEDRKSYGNYSGWRAIPGVSWSPHLLSHELYENTGSWAKYKIFTTVYKECELDATLPRDNKYAKESAVSIQRYLDDNEPVRHTDLVTWMTMSFMHIPATEDYPLTIPIANTLNATIRPFNWFLQDPTMDLHNALGGTFNDPGTCALMRQGLFESMNNRHRDTPVIL